ncbi:HNH endonuclease signature motif containing protein [uncultured Arthrobacter sp.]|uniref:HNH endonuclease n=1 Tax=uncultured Arthrobacter sp. TaxID=114050 RepID=UPI0028D450F2|nr:HNH endonuclease signature motif containing protein [uncultured Arthrobacter sp.]
MHDPTLVLLCLGVAFVASLLLAADLGRRRRWRDPQRLFTWEQKRALLARAGHRCEHKALLGYRCRATDRLEADHVVPWSRGGPTQLWNGAVLCHRHNRNKSNTIPTALYRWRLVHRRRRYALRIAFPPTKDQSPCTTRPPTPSASTRSNSS